MDTDGLRAREAELAQKLATLQERREPLRNELAEAQEALQEAREKRERGEGSLAQLSEAQSAFGAAEALDRDLHSRIEALRSELAEVRSQRVREEALDTLAEEAGMAEKLFEAWDAERVALAREIEKRTGRIVALEEQLADLVQKVAAELDRLDANLSSLSLRDVEIGPLVGYQEPHIGVGRGWVRGNPLGYKGSRPRRTHLGVGEEVVAELLEEARTRRVREGQRSARGEAREGAA